MTFANAFRVMARRLLPYFLLFLGAQFLIRVALALVSYRSLSGAADWVLPFVTGLWFDIAVAMMAAPVFLVLPALLPQSWAGGRFDRIVAFSAYAVLAFMMLFQACAEYFFWDEFTTRFNFIAVDYLIYTQEVLGNILESYPVVPLLAGALAVGCAIAWLSRKPLFAGLPPHPAFGKRLGVFAVSGLLASGAYAVTGKGLVDGMSNAAAQELGSNGLYNFVSAFFNNEIEFKKFYPTVDDAQASAFVRGLFSGQGMPVTAPGASLVERDIVSAGPMLRKNIMQITMESMSADFMGTFGNAQGLTPNLDRLSKEGLTFADMRATGTRTVRGLEALSLSVPPTPGQSILRRPGSDNLFTLGGVLQDRGYETKFIYGGHGYFDNMNGFFQGNGYETRDQGDMKAEDVHFANAWGVSDIDLFDFAIREADASFAAGKPFFSLVMTTSNHRPFTYPDGEIDIPSPGGRIGAVKFSDHAIKRLLEHAAGKPWFKDTIFVFVADHTDSVAGKEELDFARYHIPCIIWSPGFIAPQRIEPMTSQIDLAPTLLGLMDASYRSRFYGVDARAQGSKSLVFVSNYEKVALVRDDAITVLEPVNQVKQFKNGVRLDAAKTDKEFVNATISIYQAASDWHEANRRIDSRIPQ
jgi:phosphoglycerol transferase MdoB-like AlkP superfamily enzyme